MYQRGHAQRISTVPTDGQPRLAVRNIAVVARDWLKQTTHGPGKFLDSDMGFAPHFAEIARVASRHKADVILFCLWSHNEQKLGELSRKMFFPQGTRHKAVILGVNRGPEREDVEVHFRSRRSPVKLRQQFGKSSDRDAKKEAFLADASARLLGSALIVLCGETNIIETKRDEKRTIVDHYGFLDRLRDTQVRLILNPIHNYMRRYEMPLKRQALARAAHTVVCVWNRGCKGGTESRLPWAAYREGKDITDQIEEVNAIDSQLGIRIGILNVPQY